MRHDLTGVCSPTKFQSSTPGRVKLPVYSHSPHWCQGLVWGWGLLPNRCFRNKHLWEVHCFCHKVHLVVNLETQAGMSYLVKILQSQSSGFSWWMSLKTRGAGHHRGEGFPNMSVCSRVSKCMFATRLFVFLVDILYLLYQSGWLQTAFLLSMQFSNSVFP